MSATYAWEPVPKMTRAGFSVRVADALAAYFMCERHELDSNCELEAKDVHMLRAIAQLSPEDDREDIEAMVAAIGRWGTIALGVER